MIKLLLVALVGVGAYGWYKWPAFKAWVLKALGQ